MDTYLVYEIIGYVASVLIAVSLMMSAIIRLRIINMIGAATFCLYGILIGAIPVAAMNGFIVLINIYYLSKMLGDKEYFRLLRVSPESEYLKSFLSFYQDEIKKFQPDFDMKPGAEDICIFVLRDMVPGGLVIGSPDNSGILNIKLDFVIPNYRDFKISKYLFNERCDFLKEQGLTKLVARAVSKDHRAYLEKAGFRKSGQGADQFEMDL
ncbi:hypothetical protein [Natronogracilivirga saccharolytica]|uniref:N-acetyltransferase domain-containing protein n=1 Tax=Natronogracilivirga saccharolytica TaxID=2812953 RepID=A0A8J7SCY9_9BACT|nr:hypothetical protein [Natronogracilivirga saccharolytica]MBP3193766.1 hypothetical protein [Natronogracilivirga saccharolytica]